MKLTSLLMCTLLAGPAGIPDSSALFSQPDISRPAFGLTLSSPADARLEKTVQTPAVQKQEADAGKSEETKPDQTPEEKPTKPVCEQDPCKPLQSQLQLLSYSVEKDKKPLEDWKKDEAANLTLFFKEAGLKTCDLCGPGAKKGEVIQQVDASELLCGFSQPKSVEVKLLSQKDEPLLFQVEYKEVSWKGEDNTFIYSIGYPSLKLPYTTGKLQVSQAKVPQEDVIIPDPVPPIINITNVPSSPSIEGLPASPIYPESPDVPSSPGTYEPEEPGTEGSVPAPAPNIIISHYAYGTKEVEAGSEFILTIEFYNTSKTIPAENIVMQVETDSGLAIVTASNTYYFESLQSRYNLTQKIGMKALNSDTNSSPSVSVSFSYEYVENNQRMTRSNSEKIAIPVVQPDRMEITEAVILEDQQIVSGTELPLSFPYVNKGKGTLYNVSAYVEGDMESLLPVQNLGNFEPGKSGTIDMLLTPNEPGDHEFSIVITYEDAAGNEIKKTYPYQVSVMEPAAPDNMDIPDYGEMPPQEQQQGFPWLLVLLGLAVLGAVLGLVLRRKKKKKAKAPKEEVDDTDYFADEDEVLPDDYDEEDSEEDTNEEDSDQENEEQESQSEVKANEENPDKEDTAEHHPNDENQTEENRMESAHPECSEKEESDSSAQTKFISSEDPEEKTK